MQPVSAQWEAPGRIRGVPNEAMGDACACEVLDQGRP